MGAVMDVNAFGGDVYDMKIVNGACSKGLFVFLSNLWMNRQGSF
jgi:hypothetical protein